MLEYAEMLTVISGPRGGGTQTPERRPVPAAPTPPCPRGPALAPPRAHRSAPAPSRAQQAPEPYTGLGSLRAAARPGLVHDHPGGTGPVGRRPGPSSPPTPLSGASPGLQPTCTAGSESGPAGPLDRSFPDARGQSPQQCHPHSAATLSTQQHPVPDPHDPALRPQPRLLFILGPLPVRSDDVSIGRRARSPCVHLLRRPSTTAAPPSQSVVGQGLVPEFARHAKFAD